MFVLNVTREIQSYNPYTSNLYLDNLHLKTLERLLHNCADCVEPICTVGWYHTGWANICSRVSLLGALWIHNGFGFTRPPFPLPGLIALCREHCGSLVLRRVRRWVILLLLARQHPVHVECIGVDVTAVHSLVAASRTSFLALDRLAIHFLLAGVVRRFAICGRRSLAFFRCQL